MTKPDAPNPLAVLQPEDIRRCLDVTQTVLIGGEVEKAVTLAQELAKSYLEVDARKTSTHGLAKVFLNRRHAELAGMLNEMAYVEPSETPGSKHPWTGVARFTPDTPKSKSLFAEKIARDIVAGTFKSV